MLLEEIAKKKTINVDFHNHLQTGSAFRIKPKGFREKVLNMFLEEGFSELTGILDKVMKTELDVLYVTNYEDQRYETWTSKEQLEIVREVGYEIEQGDYFTFFKKGDKIKVLGKSQEIPTAQGHVLISGVKRNKEIPSNNSLEETFGETEEGELKTADHPYALVEHSGTLRNSEDPELDAYMFDALEKNGNFSCISMPFSPANYLAERASKKYQMPLVVNSDGHHPKDIGKTYNTFDSSYIDYSSEQSFRDSITYAIRDNNFERTFKPIPFWRVFHHVLMMVMYKIFKK